MTDEFDDRLFQRAAESLRAAGPRDADALAETIANVRRGASDGSHTLDGLAGRITTRARRRPLVPRGTAKFVAGLAAGVAFAAGLGLGIWAGWRMRGESYRIAAEDVGARRPNLVASPVADVAREPVQFMLIAPAASRVALVGEFNDWDPTATPMVRAAGGTWHVALPLARGRHVYAFVVDGSSWIADPQAPLAPERWFGASNSVLLVNGGRRQ